MEIETVFSWIAIGIAASLAGMIWPFKRGALGIAVNLLVGMLGAVVGGLVSYFVLPLATHGETPARFFFAASGALASLGVVHAVWVRVTELLRTRREASGTTR